MKIKPLLIELARIVVGLVFVVSGFTKAIDPAGVALKVHDFQALVFGITHPTLLGWGLPVAIALIILEFCAGAFLLMGIYRRLASRLAAVLLLFFTLLTGYVYFTGTMPDCGCFGDALKLTAWQTFIKNLVLLPMSLLLVWNATAIKHLYSKREQWIPASLAIVGIGLFVYTNLRALPFMDFRPYRIGYNIRERIREADSLYMAELNAGTRYIYERKGVKQSFSVDSLPDSTWHYVEMKQAEHLSLTPPNYSFLVLTPEGEDKTEEILTDTVGVFLFLSPDWTKAEQSRYEVVNELYSYLKKRGIKFYSVSPTVADNAAEWFYRTGAEYPALFIDATTIRTMLRANPGLVIIKDGVIVDKLASVDFPSSDEFANFVPSRLEYGEHITPSLWRLSILLLWGFLLAIGLVRRTLRWGRAAGYLSVRRAARTE